LFIADGYAATTLEQIAKRAGVRGADGVLPLREQAHRAPDMAAQWTSNEQQRATAFRVLAQQLADGSALTPGMTVDDATDIIFIHQNRVRRVSGVLRALHDVHRSVLRQLPDRLCLVGLERRRSTEELLVPWHRGGVITDRDSGEQHGGHGNGR
jgi:hypothetical protein